MLRQGTKETTAPCPKCRADMTLVVITPHPIAPEMERHTYLCRPCNQTKTYVLPNRDPSLIFERPKAREIPW